MSTKLLKKLGHYKAEGWLVGMSGKRKVYTLPEACAIGMAPRRTGKSQTAIAQLLDIARRGETADIIVGDAAGDLMPATRDAFEAAGYDVRRIDFLNPDGSDWHDPFSVLNVERKFDFDRDVDQLCHLIAPDDANTKEGHFQEFIRVLLAGVIAHMVVTKPEDATLYACIEYRDFGDERCRIYGLKDRPKDRPKAIENL